MSTDYRELDVPGVGKVMAEPGITAADIQAAMNAPDPITADDVRAEASRRMTAALGARGPADLQIKLLNATRESIRLNDKEKTLGLSQQEQARSDELRRIDAVVEALRAASNAMEKDPPVTFAEDKHWP